MAVPATARRISPEEYIERELAAETKSELIDGEIVAMAGVRVEHDRAVSGIADIVVLWMLQNPGAAGECERFSSDIRVRIPGGSYYYPDLSIACGPLIDEAHCLTNPLVVFEVLSASTERYDRGAKLKGYLSIPTLQAYVLVSPEDRTVETYMRGANGWTYEVARPPQSVSLPLDGLDLDLSRVFRRL